MRIFIASLFSSANVAFFFSTFCFIIKSLLLFAFVNVFSSFSFYFNCPISVGVNSMLNYIFNCFASFCFTNFFSSYVFSSSPFSSSSCSTFYDIFDILSPDLLNFASIGLVYLLTFSVDFFGSGGFLS